MMRTKAKLTIEMVPETAWYSNVRSAFGQHWNRIRQRIYREANNRCEVCFDQGRRHPVECHEVWEYRRGRQILVKCIALCPACHEVKHIGRAEMMGNLERALDHLAAVNGWNRALAEHHHRDAVVLLEGTLEAEMED